MSNLTRALMMGAAGVSGDKIYVDDVFSTYLYEGTGSAQTITNGIDISGEGGLVWIKNRETTGQDHALFDTERGAGYLLISNETYAQSLSTNRLSALNSNGFTVGTDSATNQSAKGIVSWTFRKAPGFFDIQTWTGNDTPRTISHNLGTVPGMILVKSLGFAEGWKVWHRGLPNTATDFLNLNESGAKESSSTIWNSTAPTSTHFSLGNNGSVNLGGSSAYTYIAYIFAHDDQSFGTGGNESIIKCGSFTGANYTESLGFEPQFLLAKRSDAPGGDWFLVDSMRGFYPQGTDSVNLRPNTNNDENTAWFHLTSDGFYYSSGTATYVYMAIRRPNKPPTAGTDVFAVAAAAGNSDVTTNFPVDLAFQLRRSAGSKAALTRLQGKATLETRNNNAETINANAWYESNTKFLNAGLFTADSAFHLFKRAPGFMDVVAYTGNAVAGRQISHNLGVAPELMIVKKRDSTFLNGPWSVYAASLTATKFLILNETQGASVNGNYWYNVEPTASVFSVADLFVTNYSGSGYVAYLFATLPGISKVGSYAGTGSAINVDCGFSAGARFILIKRTDSTGDWYVYDSARGIVSGDDPYLLINDSAGEVTNTDYIDPLSSGFTVTSSAPTGLNASGGNYIFLAIA
jgi:hypothetical protein